MYRQSSRHQLSLNRGVPSHRPTSDSIHSQLSQSHSERKSNKMTFRLKVHKLYRTPLIKFSLECLSHLILVIFFCFCSLGDFRDMLTWYESLIVVWLIALTIGEFTELHHLKFREWMSDYWNILDFCILSTYWLGLTFRILSIEDSVEYLMSAKAAFAVTSGMLVLRTFRFFVMSRRMGPLLIMIGRMMPAILTFVTLLMVFMTAAGVTIEVLLRPQKKEGDPTFDFITIQRIFYHPAFQLFGELFLEDSMDDTTCLGPGPYQGCTFHQIVPIVTFLYLFAVNIVLVNLLIAMMSRTFDDVHESSMQIWHFQRYDLLREFKGKPPVPAPLSLLSMMWAVIKLIRRKTCGGSNRVTPETNNMHAKDPRETSEAAFSRQLENFQERHTERYLDTVRNKSDGEEKLMIRFIKLERELAVGFAEIRSKMSQLESQNAKQITSLLHKVQASIGAVGKEIGSVGQAVRKQFVSMRHVSPFSEYGDIDDRNGEENQIRLQREMSIRSSSTSPYGLSPDRYATIWRPAGDTFTFKTIVVGEYTLKYMHTPNPNLKVDTSDPPQSYEDYDPYDPLNMLILFPAEEALLKKCGVDTLKRAINEQGDEVFPMQLSSAEMNLNTEMPDYDPPEYTSPYVIFFSQENPIDNVVKWAGPCVKPTVSKLPSRQNSVESETGSGFRCELQQPLPNPYRRTGLKGRGVLGTWGANHCTLHVITRVKMVEEQRMERHGDVMQEVLLFKHKDALWEIPSCFTTDKNDMDHKLRTVFGLDYNQLQKEDAEISAELQETEQILLDATSFPNSSMIQQRGDHRDTDDAWVEFDLRLVDLSSTLNKDTRVKFKIAEHENTNHMFEWVTIHRDLVMRHNSHYRIIKSLVNLKHSFW